MKFAIFGSGFGLYGYLPALMTGCRQTVCLPERYRTIVADRPDVGRFGDVIEWQPDDEAALNAAEAVVVSRRPADQLELIRAGAGKRNIRALLLEKPLAPSPQLAAEALDLLDSSGKTFRIGYNFRFTPWAVALKRELRTFAATDLLNIDWQFRAHHYAHDVRNWKRTVSEGGGALRFFGIHLVGLLAEFGYDEVVRSESKAAALDECETWTAVFKGPGLPECSVRVASNAAATRFSIDRVGQHGRAEPVVSLGDPFESSVVAGDFDRRFAILTEVCRDLIDDPATSYPWYRQSVRLWEQAESLS
ncbi:MAG: Gfo/Idh/MocA family oxidoreductase [Tardiphaga sp.]|nr:Gfo/Idh/MocA family oxidoreductase [Tardiphaga sp.]